MIGRALLVAGLAASAACSPAKSPPAGPPPVPLHLEPACDLAPSAGLSWIVDLRPRAIAATPDLIPALSLVLPEERLQRLTAGYGGIDLRQTHELCFARYSETLLTVARVPLDPERVAAAFDQRSARPPARTYLASRPRVLRLTGEIQGATQQLVLFGNEGVALEEQEATSARGTPPLRAAEAFAFGKLKRARPALAGAALERSAQVLGAAPVRAFAPGPFTGETANALGGLLRAATAVSASARWTSGSNIAVRIVLTGAWGDDASAASERLAAAAHVLSESAVGRLFGLHRPVHAPEVHVEPDALVLDATLDGMTLAQGLHDAVFADVADMMRHR